MPSQLIDNQAISFIVAKPLKWYDDEYEMGDDFPQEDANNIETLIRSRFLIPVVDRIEDKPRHWHREVQVREDALAKLRQEVVQIVLPEQEPESAPADSEESPEPTQEDSAATESGTGGEQYDPEGHTVADVLAYMEAHPDEAEAIRELERHGKNRKGIVEGY